ncbi:MAG: glycogen/starch/alpha-glucan phosphorylase [Cyclobacteriaceae bacterium]|nr:glycogen/starch/alpha-glucan phosphorylase [Cyclobacteriaceae bacterium]
MTRYPQSGKSIFIEDDRTGIEIETLKRAFLDNLFYIQGKYSTTATRNDYYLALAYTVRDRLLKRWLNTQHTMVKDNCKIVAYLSAEFLLGPHLGNNLINMGLYERVKQSMDELGINLEELMEQEEEPGLGNGGLGRLAACFLDSMATLNIPAIGYGIRYEYGIFDQEIRDGWQVEITDKWLRYGNPWEIPRNENGFIVKFGGSTDSYYDQNNRYRAKWVPERMVKGVFYDTPILGYNTNTAATLRLWKSEACESFDFQTYNAGDFYGAVNDQVVSENITKVLYPNDEQMSGKQLRLEQQYFFVSASLQDMIRINKIRGNELDQFPDKFAVQLNDTHPAIAIAEFMRLMVDEYDMEWAQAWDMTQRTFSYTNHTLLPEALEKWPLDMFKSLLPRHLDIIFEINHRFLIEISEKYPNDEGKLARLSIIDEGGEKYVRMAHLACVGSNAINGVAELHTELLKNEVLHEFYELWPEKFSNKTNGVTPRRWVVLNNPQLTGLITKKIGEGWIKDLYELRKLEQFADDPEFRKEWRKSKTAMKKLLAAQVFQRQGIKIDTNSMFDIQVKRIHEYKRQHLNILHIITLYNRIKDNPDIDMVPRTFFFGGKAAPGYFMAKLIIKLINAVAVILDNDPDVRDRLKVVFLPDYNVTNSQHVYPAADLSEQVSTAGFEASGTGNMKFSMNGALTIGTLDGANVEIREEVGEENFFLFGLTAQEVSDLKKSGYNAMEYYESNDQLKRILDMISGGYFSRDDSGLFRPLVDSLKYHDHYLLLADYQSYVDCQDEVSEKYRDQEAWTKMSVLNVARIGKFSSDRSIRDYSRDIWHVDTIDVEIPEYDSAKSANIKLVLPKKGEEK